MGEEWPEPLFPLGFIPGTPNSGFVLSRVRNYLRVGADPSVRRLPAPEGGDRGRQPRTPSRALHGPACSRRCSKSTPLRCVCGATMRVVSFILDPAVIRKILPHRLRAEPRAHAP